MVFRAVKVFQLFWVLGFKGLGVLGLFRVLRVFRV